MSGIWHTSAKLLRRSFDVTAATGDALREKAVATLEVSVRVAHNLAERLLAYLYSSQPSILVAIVSLLLSSLAFVGVFAQILASLYSSQLSILVATVLLLIFGLALTGGLANFNSSEQSTLIAAIALSLSVLAFIGTLAQVWYGARQSGRRP